MVEVARSRGLLQSSARAKSAAHRAGRRRLLLPPPPPPHSLRPTVQQSQRWQMHCINARRQRRSQAARVDGWRVAQAGRLRPSQPAAPLLLAGYCYWYRRAAAGRLAAAVRQSGLLTPPRRYVPSPSTSPRPSCPLPDRPQPRRVTVSRHQSQRGGARGAYPPNAIPRHSPQMATAARLSTAEPRGSAPPAPAVQRPCTAAVQEPAQAQARAMPGASQPREGGLHWTRRPRERRPRERRPRERRPRERRPRERRPKMIGLQSRTRPVGPCVRRARPESSQWVVRWDHGPVQTSPLAR